MAKLKPPSTHALKTLALPIGMGVLFFGFWFIVANVYATPGSIYHLFCLLAAAMGAVLTFFYISQNIDPKQKDRKFIGLWSVLVVGLVLPTLFLVMDWVRSPASAASVATPPPVLAAAGQLPQAEAPVGPTVVPVALLKDQFLKVPLDDWGWQVSPNELDIEFDRQVKGELYKMNLTYMTHLKQRIAEGYTSSAILEYLSPRTHKWEYVRNEYLPIPILDGATDLLYQSANPRVSLERHRHITVHAELVPPKEALVLQTERVIPDGKAMFWGPVWREIHGRKVSWDMKIVIRDAAGHKLPVHAFTQAPPVVGFCLPGESVLRKQYAAHFYASEAWDTVEFHHLSPQVNDGHVLVIQIPPGFGDCFVRVNLRLK